MGKTKVVDKSSKKDKKVESVKEGRVTKPAQTPKAKSKDVAKAIVKKEKKSKKAKTPTPEPESDSESSASEDDDDDSSSSEEEKVEACCQGQRREGQRRRQSGRQGGELRFR
jgi:nucleolin